MGTMDGVTVSASYSFGWTLVRDDTAQREEDYTEIKRCREKLLPYQMLYTVLSLIAALALTAAIILFFVSAKGRIHDFVLLACSLLMLLLIRSGYRTDTAYVRKTYGPR